MVCRQSLSDSVEEQHLQYIIGKVHLEIVIHGSRPLF